MELKRYNCIVVFDKGKDKILFCKREKEPYQGLFNFVGGKPEERETGREAAYRELFEETGIDRRDICLFHLMDITYYQQEYVLEIYVGVLHEEITLVEETNPLVWFGLDENFADASKYAGDQNIAHIVKIALKFLPEMREETSRKIKEDCCCIGIDGCKGGWIAAVMEYGEIRIEKYRCMEELVYRYKNFDNMLIDMVIGLPGNLSQYDNRPDSVARRLIAPRTSTIFAVPSRQTVYECDKESQVRANRQALGKGLSAQARAIIPKMRELDEFLLDNEKYKNVIKESHPEVCFSRLNGSVVMTKKAQYEGLVERVDILSRFIPEMTYKYITRRAMELKCNADDIVDAVCLAVTANLDVQGMAEEIPQDIQMDDAGLKMQMVIPKK